jgi:hypothetical protein
MGLQLSKEMAWKSELAHFDTTERVNVIGFSQNAQNKLVELMSMKESMAVSLFGLEDSLEGQIDQVTSLMNLDNLFPEE